MNEYILTALGVAFAAAAVTALAPEGKGGGLSRHIKLLTSLALLCTLISPLLNLAGRLSELAKDPPSFSVSADGMKDLLREKLNEAGSEEAALLIRDDLCSAFGIAEKNITVEVEADRSADVFTVSSVKVFLSGAAVTVSPYEIEARVTETVGAPCRCDIGKKGG